jgi:hypothetical protein
MGKKYLVYVDILGFEELVKEIGASKGVEEREVRSKFIDVIKERIEVIETKGRIIGKQYGESDDWLLVTDDLDEVFWIISEILDHNTKYIGYKKIPLEIGVGTAEFDRWAKFNGKDLIIENDTIKLLKKYILSHYRKWYKMNRGGRIKSTFVVLTEEQYEELEPLDKKMCKKIEHKVTESEEEKKCIRFFVADVDKVILRGKMFDFLEKVGYPSSKLYGRIDDVYVPPAEYKDIQDALKEKKIVFITGTQEYGKTYTAVRLMWEYFKKGYEPCWIRGEEERERNIVRQRLEEIRIELKPNRIIYFEDPFGKTRYEKRESLEKEIGTIIKSIKNVKDSYVIITSREEVFKEFEKEKLSTVDVKEFEKRLNLLRPSYDYERRKEILSKWAESEGCIWYKDKRLRNLVLKSMEDDEVLSTPLRIKDFAFDTVNVDRKDQLEKKTREKSEEVAMVFSREIRNMTDDKILFLLFLFISNYFDINSMKEIYREMKDELNLAGAQKFDRILNWFNNDKITIGGYVEFSHPSYSGALKYLLVEDGFPTRINEDIFSRLLLRLVEKDDVAEDVVKTIARYFNEITEEMRNKLLFRLSENDEVAGDVAEIVAENYNKLPENLQNLLFNFAEKREIAESVAWAIRKNLSALPRKDQKNLLFKLAENDEVAGDVAEIVAENYSRLPESLQNLLFNLAERDETASAVAHAVKDNFGWLPGEVRNELLFRLAEKDEAAEDVALTITTNFHKLPKNIRNLLFKLSERDETVGGVAWAITINFHGLPKNIRNLLFKLSERDAAATQIAMGIVANFERLPESLQCLLPGFIEKGEVAFFVSIPFAVNFMVLDHDLREEVLSRLIENDKIAMDIVAFIIKENFVAIREEIRNELLLKLSENDEVAGDVAEIVAENYDELPESLQNLLFNFAEKREIAGSVAWAIAENYNKLPESLQNLLFNLAERDETASAVADAVKNNFGWLPEEVRNELLFRLAEKDEAAEDVAEIVAFDFDMLSKDARNLLDKLQEPLQRVILDLSKSSSSQHNKDALYLISNAWVKISPDFLLKVLNILSKNKERKIRVEAIRMIKNL